MPFFRYQPNSNRTVPTTNRTPSGFGISLRCWKGTQIEEVSEVGGQIAVGAICGLSCTSAFWQLHLRWTGRAGRTRHVPSLPTAPPVHPELAVVAHSFHLKPLMRFLQSADRYQVLALNREEIKLFEGNRDVLDEIALAPGVPLNDHRGAGGKMN